MTRVIIITGAGSGIGQGTALTFAERGDAVVIADIDLAAAQRTLAQTAEPSAHMALRCDVSDESSVQTLIAAVLARYGRIDVLVNNAGILISKPLHLTSWSEWQRILNTNLGSVYLCSAAVLPTMLAQHSGAIINLASPHSFATTTNIAAYAASKGGVVALTRQMAMDYGRLGIRTNCVVPGAIDTAMLRSDIAHGDGIEASLAGWARVQPIGRVGQPEDIAKVIYWLASPEAGFVLGAAIHADGGMLAQLTPPTE
jgi:NAD(P)-dependent dehydrogenase (short-subunit alcohol dehydrogenase family)